MANYTAADIKALREKTAAGMMDVKKALDEADGDLAKAEEILRVKGLKGVTKREGRTTSNGLVIAKAEGGTGTLVEVLCETDFVAKGERFGALADEVLATAIESGATDAESLLAATTLQGLLSDPLDKLITFTVVALILAALPGRFLQRFPFVRQYRVFTGKQSASKDAGA